MTSKIKYKRQSRIGFMPALAVLMVSMWVLMARLTGIAAEEQTEYYLNELRSETVIRMIETVEPSREVDIMLYSEREEAGVSQYPRSGNSVRNAKHDNYRR